MRKLLVVLLLAVPLAAQFSDNAKKLQGRKVCSDPPSNAEALVWSAARACWEPSAAGSGDVVGPGAVTVNTVPVTDAAGTTLLDSGMTATGGVLTAPGGIITGTGLVAGGDSWYELAANGNNYRKMSVPDLLTADLELRWSNTLPTVSSLLVVSAPTAGVSTLSFTPVSHTITGEFGSNIAGATALVADVEFFKTEYACTIQPVVHIMVKPSTAVATFKLWRLATGGTALPTVANSINTAGVASDGANEYTLISSAADFTSTAIAVGDLIGVSLTPTSGSPVWAKVQIECQ